MHADIPGEPSQNRRQLVVRAAVKRCVVDVPVALTPPARVLKLMLDIKEPHGERRRNQPPGALREKELPNPHEPDHRHDDRRYRYIRSHCTEPRFPASAHQTEWKAMVH